jgi:hypothetical protein
MAKYVVVVKEYFTMLETFIKEYFCDVGKIYCRIFALLMSQVHVHAHRLAK